MPNIRLGPIFSPRNRNACQRRTKTAPNAGAKVHHLAGSGRSKSAPSCWALVKPCCGVCALGFARLAAVFEAVALAVHFPKIWFETSDFSRKRSHCAPPALYTTEPFDFSRRRFISKMWTWWVSRSSRAPVRRSDPNVLVHSSNGRLDVTMVDPRS